jgi:hypothetical protein
MSRIKKILIYHPLCFGLFPILFLYAHNLEQMGSWKILPYLFWPMALICAVWLFIAFLIRDFRKAALISSLATAVFFLFGHFSSFLTPILYKYSDLADLQLFLVMALSVITLSIMIIISSSPFFSLTKFLNIFSLILVLIQLGTFPLKNSKSPDSRTLSLDIKKTAAAEARSDYPDIYYIILDGYARKDVLQNIYGYDNSPFTDFLKKESFYVAASSTSNYMQTGLSLSSSLNFDYVENLLTGMDISADDRRPLQELIAGNKTSRDLHSMGYENIAFSSGYAITNSESADRYFSPQNSMDEFESVFWETTFIPTLKKYLSIYQATFDSVREQRLFALNTIPLIKRKDKPMFVFAHIVCPHPPFVFNEDGSPLNLGDYPEGFDGSHYFKTRPDKDEYRKYYVGQVKFINKKIISMIESMLSKSGPKPIIILQADHGPGSMLDFESKENTNLKERLSILDAVYFPDKDYKEFNYFHTPVNTFRIIFNKYFNAHYPLLPDKNYFSTWSDPYKFFDASDEL